MNISDEPRHFGKEYAREEVKHSMREHSSSGEDDSKQQPAAAMSAFMHELFLANTWQYSHVKNACMPQEDTVKP